MKLEQQVCIVSLAKRLKELGVKQESLFSFVKQDGTEDYYLGEFPDNKYDLARHVSAFTVGELGEMLPETINTKDGSTFYFKQSFTYAHEKRVSYISGGGIFFSTLEISMALKLGYIEEVSGRWKPKQNEPWYFFTESLGEGSSSGFFARDDNARYEVGNCFRTSEERNEAIKSVKQTLLKFHEERNK